MRIQQNSTRAAQVSSAITISVTAALRDKRDTTTPVIIAELEVFIHNKVPAHVSGPRSIMHV